MPYYQCRLATEGGRVVSMSLLAPSMEDCRKHFESEGFCILSVRRDWKKIQIPELPFEKKIKDKDFIMFNQELVALIKAGYPILKSIEMITNRIKNIRVKELLMLIEDEIRAGKSLSEAFSSQKKYFSTVYIASLMAGERSANLAGTINRYIEYAKTITRTKSRIRTALNYPTLLLFFSLVLLTVLLNFVIPRFFDFYADFDAQLPATTVALVSLSLFVRKYFYFILLFLGFLIIAYFQMRNREKTGIWLDKVKLKIPYGNRIWIESSVSLFCRTLYLLLGGGISLLSAIGIARQSAPNKYLVRKMQDLPDYIKNGESLSESLEKAEFFPPLALDMIRIGESSANLEGMLSDVAEVYDERIQSKIDTFVSLVEPVIIIFVGLIVAVMLLSVYLPIFNIIRVTR
jgi:type IV pilus assembly protein PilC